MRREIRGSRRRANARAKRSWETREDGLKTPRNGSPRTQELFLRVPSPSRSTLYLHRAAGRDHPVRSNRDETYALSRNSKCSPNARTGDKFTACNYVDVIYELQYLRHLRKKNFVSPKIAYRKLAYAPVSKILPFRSRLQDTSRQESYYLCIWDSTRSCPLSFSRAALLRGCLRS